MQAQFSYRAYICMGILFLSSLAYLWDWVETGYSNTANLAVALFLGLLASGLLLRLNMARVATIATSIIAAVTSLILTGMFGITGLMLNESATTFEQQMLGASSTTENTSGMSTTIFNIPWVMIITGLLVTAAYIWLFLYLSSSGAQQTFNRKVLNR